MRFCVSITCISDIFTLFYWTQRILFVITINLFKLKVKMSNWVPTSMFFFSNFHRELKNFQCYFVAIKQCMALLHVRTALQSISTFYRRRRKEIFKLHYSQCYSSAELNFPCLCSTFFDAIKSEKWILLYTCDCISLRRSRGYRDNLQNVALLIKRKS